jgi:hypothetical protein
MKRTILLFTTLAIVCLLSAQEKNLGFEVTSGNSMMDHGYWKEASFYPGNFLLAYYDKPLNTIPEEFKGNEVVFYFEVTLSEKIIHRHVYTSTCPEYNYWKVNLIPDPWDNVSIVFRHDWNGNFVRVISLLPKGSHLLKISTYLEKDEQRIQTGYGEITYDNSGEYDTDLMKMADLIDQNSTFDPQKEMAEWIEKNGGHDAWRKANEEDMQKSDAEDAERESLNYYKVTVKNNCNETFTLTVNDAQTYIINGLGTVEISISRGKSGIIKRNGIAMITVTEKQEGSTVAICN